MTCYYIHSGICLSKNDIQRLSSGIWLIKKNCGCKSCNDILNSDRKCDACGFIIKAQDTQEKINACKGWCDRMAVAGVGWCGKAFKSLKCQTACGLAVMKYNKVVIGAVKEKAFIDAALNLLKI